MEQPASIEFVDLLNLRGKRYSSASLDGVLIAVYDFAAAIWQSQRMYSFVDHGITHSHKVLDNALRILNALRPSTTDLSDIERLVLGIASLVHDVGMQYERYPKTGIVLSAKEIRKQHTSLGFEMVEEACEGTFNERGGPVLPRDEYYRFFVQQWGSGVGFAHSGREFWNKLAFSTYDPMKEGGEQLFRPRLLAAAFRLADELHCEYTRIGNLEQLESPKLSDQERAHWVACYYARAVDLLSPGSGAIRFLLHWRIPEDCGQEEEQLIRSLLEELRESKINSEIQFVEDYMKWESKMEPCMLTFKLFPTPEKVRTLQSLPDSVRTYVRAILRPYQFKQKAPPQVGGVQELPNDEKAVKLKYVAQEFVQSGLGALNGHFSLKTKWHTNRYIQCRELCARIDFVADLSAYLKDFYRSQDFTDILAIGTSAIRLASQLSVMSGTRLTYTFASSPTSLEASGREAYTAYEREFTVSQNGKVLIMDDIWGVGGVIRDIAAELKRKFSPKYLRVFTIYSLGDTKRLLSDLDGIEIDYLVAFPDVLYAEEKADGLCELCKADPGIVRIEE